MLATATAASAQPAQQVTPQSGDSQQATITITLPNGARCSQDSTHQYQIFPYITTADPKSLRYTGGQIQSLPWFTDTTGNNTASAYPTGTSTAAVGPPPNISWAFYQTAPDWNFSGADLQPGTYNVGVMCLDTSSVTNPSGAPDIPGNGDATQNGQENFWNTQFTFTPKPSNAADFTWTATTGAGNALPEAPLAIALPLSFLALAGAGAVVLRRRRRTGTATA
jgi:hypothetical protein